MPMRYGERGRVPIIEGHGKAPEDRAGQGRADHLMGDQTAAFSLVHRMSSHSVKLFIGISHIGDE